MPDISMCLQSQCPKSKLCARFLAKMNPYRQTFFAPVWGENGCSDFWCATHSKPGFAIKEPDTKVTCDCLERRRRAGK